MKHHPNETMVKRRIAGDFHIILGLFFRCSTKPFLELDQTARGFTQLEIKEKNKLHRIKWRMNQLRA
jgi:hypothetical protein